MIMQFSMLLGAYLTYQLTTPEISLVGRLAGGLLIWVFSIVDANGIAGRRLKAWDRIQAGLPGPSKQAAKVLAGGSGADATPAPVSPAKPSSGRPRRKRSGTAGRPAASGGRDT
jgi:hypothetical protein